MDVSDDFTKLKEQVEAPTSASGHQPSKAPTS